MSLSITSGLELSQSKNVTKNRKQKRLVTILSYLHPKLEEIIHIQLENTFHSSCDLKIIYTLDYRGLVKYPNLKLETEFYDVLHSFDPQIVLAHLGVSSDRVIPLLLKSRYQFKTLLIDPNLDYFKIIPALVELGVPRQKLENRHKYLRRNIKSALQDVLGCAIFRKYDRSSTLKQFDRVFRARSLW